MPGANTPLAPAKSVSRSRRGLSAVEVLGELEQLYGTLQPGNQFPSHRELARRFDASERAVGWALDELARQGKIIKRLGRGGTFVAESSPEKSGNIGIEGGEVSRRAVGTDTLVTISEPDGSLFDRALQLLARHPEAVRMAINCRLMQREEAATFVLPTDGSRPLGYVVFGNYFAPLAQKLQSAGHRVVLIGTPPLEGPAGVPNVHCDHEEGGYLIVRHLLELGHRHFVFQGGEDFLQHPRWHGALRALRAAKVEILPQLLSAELLASWRKSPTLAREFFTREGAPTAAVGWNDHQAVQLLTLLNCAGVRVPEDVSLVGYDDLPQSATITPALSTVDSCIERQLNTALRLLTQSEAASPNHTVVVLPTLVRRESTSAVDT